MNTTIKEEYKEIRNKIIKSFFSCSEYQFLNSDYEISTENLETLLRKIFDESRFLGLKQRKNNILNLEEIISFISSLEIDCFNREIQQKDNYLSLEKKDCFYKNQNSYICTYWKEALDGLIMGLGDQERYSRYRSIKYGKNKTCIDAFYYENNRELQYGEVPEKIINFIIRKNKKYSENNLQIKPLGLNENTFFYNIKDSSEISPFRKKFIIEAFEKTFRKNFPDFIPFENSPKAVIEEVF
ncbi:MAG: hypothetical protein U0457_05780 [Candidatus Sericytochromatia bacterium]